MTASPLLGAGDEEMIQMARMKIYRRLMLVGAGGIGGRLVVQAEQALRVALCGPDGSALADGSFARAMAPYELPRCIQSVYFDFDEADAENVRRSTADLPAGVVDSTRVKSVSLALSPATPSPEIRALARTSPDASLGSVAAPRNAVLPDRRSGTAMRPKEPLSSAVAVRLDRAEPVTTPLRDRTRSSMLIGCPGIACTGEANRLADRTPSHDANATTLVCATRLAGASSLTVQTPGIGLVILSV
jgi:hypothetical protein